MTAAMHTLGSLSFQSPGFGWLESLLLALGITAVVFAYTVGLRSRQHTPPIRIGLLTLRLGAIICVFVALCHPACVREELIAQPTTLAIVLDDSASMSQPSGERAAADGEPVSRYECAVDVLNTQLRPALAQTHDLRLFDVQARALDFEKLPDEAGGPRSALTDTLVRVQQDLRDRHLAGIVLLSDGRQVSERPATGGVEQLRVPVHALQIVGDAAAADTRNLALQAVSANRRALVGNTVRVAVDIAGEGVWHRHPAGVDTGKLPVPQVQVSILEGDKVVAATTIRWPTERPVVRTELTFIPRRPGEFTYAVQIDPQPGEISLADNRQTFPLHVSAKPLTVLYVDGVLRWEGKFLREALANDPDINVVATVRTARPGTDRGSQGLLLPEQLANLDVVILGDVEATFFSTSELSALRTWVTDGGGAVLLTGGYRSFGPDGLGATVLRDILPVEFSAAPNPQSDQPFNLKLTEAGRQHPIFDLTNDRVRDTAFFHALPPLAGCSRIAGVKPAAQVLAVNPQITAPSSVRPPSPTNGGTGPPRPASSGLPVLIVQEVGAGRTMVFAVDTTWRWRMVVGGFTGDSSFYTQFWGQLVRWMATGEEETPLQLTVATDRYRYKLGQTIELSIELCRTVAAGPRAGRPTGWKPVPHTGKMPVPHEDVAAGLRTGRSSSGTARVPTAGTGAGRYIGDADRNISTLDRYHVTATALNEDGDHWDVPLAELDDNHFRGTSAAGAAGRLDLFVRAEPLKPDDKTTELSAVATVQIERPDLETLDTRPDPQWLAQITQLSGGRVIRPDQIEKWAAELPADPVQTVRAQTSGPAGDRILAAIFLALLCTEWILRRRSRLA
ncbi:MAG: hypothetical protein KAY37_09070 [Phycisphaerae bacterium]|nr:hypothetical protein [Phycisphaerae bacterium]